VNANSQFPIPNFQLSAECERFFAVVRDEGGMAALLAGMANHCASCTQPDGCNERPEWSKLKTDLEESAFYGRVARLLSRTQNEDERAILEDIIGRGYRRLADPVATVRYLIREILARAAERRARELHVKFCTGPEKNEADLTARLDALRQAHQLRGTLNVKDKP
jgi:hypothetical protein